MPLWLAALVSRRGVTIGDRALPRDERADAVRYLRDLGASWGTIAAASGYASTEPVRRLAFGVGWRAVRPKRARDRATRERAAKVARAATIARALADVRASIAARRTTTTTRD